VTYAIRASGASRAVATTSSPCASTRAATICAPGLCQRAAGAGIARVLEPHAVARIEDQAANHLQRPLRARDDEDLIGGAGRAARRLHVFGDRLSELPKSCRIGVVELSERHGAQASGDEPRPESDRKQIERRHAETEGARRTAESPRGSGHAGQ